MKVLAVTERKDIRREELVGERNKREDKIPGLTNKNQPAYTLKTDWREP